MAFVSHDTLIFVQSLKFVYEDETLLHIHAYIMFNDLMDNIEWFFNLHDKNKDGFLSKDEVLTLSESFLVGWLTCSYFALI